MTPDPESQIRRNWELGKAALETALCTLSTAVPSGPPSDDIAKKLRDGDLREAKEILHALSGGNNEICALLNSAEGARNEAWKIASIAYAQRLAQRARAFGGHYEQEKVIEATWDRVYRRLYTWRGQGRFYAWLSAIFTRSLQDHMRKLARERLQHQVFRGDHLIAESRTPDEDSTTKLGVRFSFAAFKKSLDAEKLLIWEEWIELAETGSPYEQIYIKIALGRGCSAEAVKAIILRIQAEFKVLCSGPDLSWVVALWIGSETQSGSTAVVAKGIGIEDEVKIIVARQVKQANTRAFMRMFETLRRWGLLCERRIIVVIDDSEGLREAVEQSLAENTVIQSCIHCVIRNVTGAIPEDSRRTYERTLLAAYRTEGEMSARAKLMRIVNELTTLSPRAACMLRGQLETSLAIKQFRIPRGLESHLLEVKFVSSVLDEPSALGWLGAAFAELRVRRSIASRRAALAKLAHDLRPHSLVRPPGS